MTTPAQDVARDLIARRGPIPHDRLERIATAIRKATSTTPQAKKPA